MIPERKKIGVRKIADGAAGVGYVESIQDGDRYSSRPHDGMAVVHVRFGDKPKPSKPGKSETPHDYREPRSCEFPVPSAAAKKLNVGQKVRVTLTPA